MSSRQALVLIQLPTQWIPGTLSPRIKRPGRETDDLPPNSAIVKKTWIYTSTPPYAFMECAYLVKHRNKVTFLFNPQTEDWVETKDNPDAVKTGRMSVTARIKSRISMS
jgi:hypothetical protein